MKLKSILNFGFAEPKSEFHDNIITLMQIGLVLAGDETVGTIAATSNNTVSDGVWHSMILRLSSGNMQLFVDGAVAMEITSGAQITGTNSPYLFIGGIPSQLLQIV